jgi:diguanylate cyclase (GGDEF)-like protein
MHWAENAHTMKKKSNKEKSHPMTWLRKLILGVYLLVMALGVVLSSLIYFYGNSVMAVTESLVQENLPRLNEISRLRQAIFEQRPILYEYYATADRAVFLEKINRSQEEIEAGLRRIHRFPEGDVEVASIQRDYDHLNALAEQLDATLKNPSEIDWDKAREILSEVTATERQILPHLDGLVAITQRSVQHSSALSQSRTQFMISMVIGFSVIIFAIAMLVGYYVNAFISETAERRRLAMFPERSPNPVLRLSWDGAVTYANPASITLAEKLGLPDVSALIPEDLSQRIGGLKPSDDESAHWEYPIANRIIDCDIHMLKDLQARHVYLVDITERKQAEERLVYQAYHDVLTGLPNRRMFSERLEETIHQQREESAIGIALFRLDRLKLILETQGRDVSDNLLIAAAIRFDKALRENGGPAHEALLFRFEGATFGLLLPKLADAHELALLADRLQSSMDSPLMVESREFFFTLSIGASIFPLDGRDPETLVKNAEAAVNRVRQNGGNGFQCYTQDMNENAEQWLALESGLRRALEKGELALHYQPQVSLKSGRIIGMEALLRWEQAGNGFISPAEFIPVAEEAGLIIPIGAWVLRSACLQLKFLQSQGYTNVVMAVNISARQFQHPQFLQLVADTLRETGLAPQHLELEITESVVMQDAERTIATLRELHEMGIQLSIDDFGTGYSSLSYLRHFPIDKLKVDQSFVRNLTTDVNAAAITRSVVLLGHSLNLRVIAEGVEEPAQLALLRELECEEMQGYLFSRPIAALELEALLQSGKTLPI